MARFFNIGGPCTAATNYMLAAAERMPDVMPLIDKGQYFVIHAPRQCGKTTMFLGLVNEINAKGWLVVFDSDYGKPWNEKISHETIDFEEKKIHLVRC